MYQEQTSLRCDRHQNFVVDLKPGTTFETFFGKKHLDVIEKLGLVRSREPNKERNIALNYLKPLVRKRPGLKPFPLSFFEEPNDHGGESNARSESSHRSTQIFTEWETIPFIAAGICVSSVLIRGGKCSGVFGLASQHHPR
jgi:hypothetical protein